MRRYWPWSDRPCGVEAEGRGELPPPMGRPEFWTYANPGSTSPGCSFPEAETRREPAPENRPTTLKERPGNDGLGTTAPIAALLSGPALPPFAYVLFGARSQRLGAGASGPARGAAGNGTTAAGERHEAVGEVTGEVTADSRASDTAAPSGTTGSPIRKSIASTSNVTLIGTLSGEADPSV